MEKKTNLYLDENGYFLEINIKLSNNKHKTRNYRENIVCTR